MKILNITSVMELRGGDSQMYTIYNLLKDKSDFKQYILCPENSVLSRICKKDTASFFTYKKNKLKLINLVIAIVKICRKESISIIHIHDSTALNAGLLAMKFLNKSTSLILSRKRNNRIKNKFLNRYKYSHPSIKKIVCVSKAVEAIFENIIPDKERLLTIYDAIDVAKFAGKESQNILHKEFNFSPETIIIGNIAGLTNQKDIYTFIDTAKKIKDKNNTNQPIKFVIIGDGPLKNDLTAYTKSLHLQNEVFFTGFRNNIADLLPEFHVFLTTSITEGLPLTVYEAFACKVPVVATKAGGIPEVVLNLETGFLSELKDSEMLSENVLEILTNTYLKENIKTNAFNLVYKNHDLSVMEENYYQFYRNFKK
ncbi:glycosyltransferase [Flavobacterium sp.]|uniref:glycosyltransferase n=1 Tax=Flavobacterium sp. TaxID=239 RepID=UPI001B75E50A|nr:glycosyltransferase [Flavobacterium sp.]MBP6180658.1 glycosyltransferase [Flavobacterium sp.]